MKPYRQSAQALLWLTLMLPLFLGIAGLAIDGALVLNARRELQSAADGAARAGATRVDIDLVRRTGGDTVQLDANQARLASHAYLEDRLPREVNWGASLERRVEATPRRVKVTLDATVHTAFMRVFRRETVPVTASASADIKYGIDRAR